MYKITQKIADYLIQNSKDLNIPGIEKDSVKPFIAKNINAIGSINSLLVFGSDCKYLIEVNIPETELDGKAGISGYWLYKQSDLKKLDDSFEVPRSAVDTYAIDLEAVIDISDCAIEMPNSIEKLVCTKIETFDRLFVLEPDLRNCLIAEVK